MKYRAKLRWAIDFDVVHEDSDLCAGERIDFVKRLYKALSANGNACGVHYNDEYNIELWGDNGGDNQALIFICAEMLAHGCTLESWEPAGEPVALVDLKTWEVLPLPTTE